MMAGLDEKTIEEANRAFDEQVYSLSDWEEDVKKGDAVVPAAGIGSGGDDRPEPPVEEPGSGGDRSMSPPSKPSGEPVGKLTREQARGLVRADYRDFDDVVGDNGINPGRLAEYTSVIPFWYKSFRDGKEKMGTMSKYPLFLDLFGVTEATSISMSDVYRKFAPEKFDADMKADEEAGRLARAAGEIVGKRGLDFGRKLDEDDYAILERNGVPDPRRFTTVAQVTGMDASVMDYDEDTHVVYNADYAEAVGNMTGSGDSDGEIEVVSLDDVIAGLDPKVLKGFLGKSPSEIHGTESEMDGKDDSEPFFPFDMPGNQK